MKLKNLTIALCGACLMAPALMAQQPAGKGAKKYPFFDGAVDPASKEVMKQAEADIEKYRKGDFELIFVDRKGNPVKDARVCVELSKHQFDFGTNFFGIHTQIEPELREKVLQTTLDIFNKIVVCDMWQKDNYAVSRTHRPKLDIAWAKKNNMRMRMHSVLYHEPRWIMRQNYSEKQCWDLIRQRCKYMGDNYSKTIYEYDIINEMLSSIVWNKNQADQHRFELWAPNYPRFEKVEEAKKAFDVARRYLPDAKLVGLEAQMPSVDNPVFCKVVQYWKDLAAIGGDFDYVGTQCHFWLQGRPVQEGGTRDCPDLYTMSGVSKGLDLLGSIGKPVVITEFNGPSRSLKEPLEAQNKIWSLSDEENSAWQINFYKLAFSKPYIVELVRWYHIDGLGGKSMDGGILKKNGEPHQIYYDLRKLIKEEWHTKVDRKTDDAGKLSFRGFYGEYTVEAPGYKPADVVLFDNASKTVKVTLEKK